MSTWRRRQMMAAAVSEGSPVWPGDLQRVQYIDSGLDGTWWEGRSWINTYIQANDKILDFDFAWNAGYNSGDRSICGSFGALNIAIYQGRYYFKIGGPEQNIDIPGGLDTAQHHFRLDYQGVLEIDGQVVATDVHSHYTDTGPVIICNRSRGDAPQNNKGASGKMGVFDILTIGGALVFHGVPAVALAARENADGVTVPIGTAGMYDEKSGKFFTSVTGVEFIAGPTYVEP